MKKLYEETDVQAIADAIRDRKNIQLNKVGKMKINAMAEAIKGIRLGCPMSVSIHMQDGKWVRPDGWTDLDALTYGNNELYMTFDNSDRIDDSHCSFSITGADYTVTIGTQTFNQSAGTTFQYAFTESDGTYPLVHVKASGDVTSFSFQPYTVDGRTYAEKLNPMVERVGCLYNWGSSNWGTYYLEREKVGRSTATGSQLAYTFQNCYSLQSLDLSGLDTSNWNVSTLVNTFYNCYSLQSLDLSGLDTSNWNVSALDNTFYNCYSLQSLDLSGLDTTNWKVSSLYCTFSYCYSLQSLDLSGLDTTNWNVSTLASTFRYCYSLQSLDLSGLDTTNWNVSSLAYTFSYCYSLQSIDLSGLDTTNWNVSSLASTFYNCYSLQSLDLSGLDTTNWNVSSLAYTFSYCYSLQSLDLSGLDTTNWNLDLGSAIAKLFNCKKINLSSIDMSKVTRIGMDSGDYRSFKGMLEDFVCGENNYGKFNPTAYSYLYIEECPHLTRKSILEMGKMLATVTTPHYFRLGTELLNKLTDEEKAEITAKGWTIA